MLLIDEIDRADEAFEAYLLELLSDFQMTIPELGTVHAVTRPLVVITSNGTRELSDALRRRCLYQYIDYPVVREGARDRRDQGAAAAGALARQLVAFVQSVRRMDLRKKPGHRRDARLDGGAAAHGRCLDRRGCRRAHPRPPAALLKTREDRAGFTREVVAHIAAGC